MWTRIFATKQKLQFSEDDGEGCITFPHPVSYPAEGLTPHSEACRHPRIMRADRGQNIV
jgi:hypothetical protein